MPSSPRAPSGCLPSRPLRVVVWSTGGVGANAIRAVACRPDLELAGVWVHSPDKVGRDAGELAESPPSASPPPVTVTP